MKIPSQYLPVMPYIILNDAEAFLDFTKKVFGAREQLIVPGENERTIMHGEIKIFEAVIMFAQKPDGINERPCGMFIYVANVDDIYYKAIENSAISLMPPGKQEYGYTAGFEDTFGNQWWIVEGS
jgi:PhnB protein